MNIFWYALALFDFAAWWWLYEIAKGISRYCYCGVSL
jgi:hypothetical protein